MDVPEPRTVNCREAMVGWDDANSSLDSSGEAGGRATPYRLAT
jgi:hypothetical protein